MNILLRYVIENSIPAYDWDGLVLDVVFSFLSLRFSLIVRFAFFFVFRLPLSRFPFSLITYLLH